MSSAPCNTVSASINILVTFIPLDTLHAMPYLSIDPIYEHKHAYLHHDGWADRHPDIEVDPLVVEGHVRVLLARSPRRHVPNAAQALQVYVLAVLGQNLRPYSKTHPKEKHNTSSAVRAQSQRKVNPRRPPLESVLSQCSPGSILPDFASKNRSWGSRGVIN